MRFSRYLEIPLAAAFAITLSNAADAAVVTLRGDVWSGYFIGVDRDRDGNLTLGELADIRMRDNFGTRAGPSAVYWDETVIHSFRVPVNAPTTDDGIVIRIDYYFYEPEDGAGWDACEDPFGFIEYCIYTDYNYTDYLTAYPMEINWSVLSVTQVPLPAGLGLIASAFGLLGGLGFWRRRTPI